MRGVLTQKLDYTGSRPGRAREFVEERIFYHLWIEYNGLAEVGVYCNSAMAEIASLIGPVPEGSWRDREVSERDACVATTIIQWLGSKCGCCFLADAEHLAETSNSKESAYLEHWQKEMLTRQVGRDGGFSGLEHILNSQIPRILTHRDQVDLVSLRDEQVAEATVRWLAKKRGQEFIAEAERRITVQKKRNLELFNELWNQQAHSSCARVA